ncbi:MAG: photosynthetic reaction center subunit H [Pseudomonadota bacterium]
MIFSGEFVPGIDLVDVCLWAFVIFFFGLVFFLQAEGRREGYPLEADTTGKIDNPNQVWIPTPKKFRMPHGREDVLAPNGKRETRKLALKRQFPWPGSAYLPTGNPMVDGVGPASYAERLDAPDLTDDGRNRIVPFRVDDDYTVAKEDADPRGMAVLGTDDKVAGTVTDLWVDQSEAVIRYLEVELPGAGGPTNVLLPMGFAKIVGSKRQVEVHAIKSDQFADVPKTKSPDSVTRLEEDKIMGYYGGGKLYATPDRVEPWV